MTIIHGMLVTEVAGHQNVVRGMLREMRSLNGFLFAGRRLCEFVLQTQLSKQPLYLPVVGKLEQLVWLRCQPRKDFIHNASPAPL